MQERGVEKAGLRKQAQLEEMTIRFGQLISTEGVRRQMIHFAYSRGLGPVLETYNLSDHATSDWEYQPNLPERASTE